MGASSFPVVPILIEIVLFIVLILVATFIVKKVFNSDSKFLNLEEYLPKEEIQMLTQLAYLALMSACFLNVMYTLIYVNFDTVYFALADVTLSLFIAVSIDKSTLSRKLVVLLLVPYGSLYFLLFNATLVGVLDLIHILVFIYFIKYYYDKFHEYTESNGLGIAVILVFIIIFVSFILTAVAENENPLHSILMVTNAFTSNGYAVLGDTDVGKLTSLMLAWSGYILATVGTATLTTALLSRHFRKRFDDYDDKLDALNDKIDNLEDLIKGNSDD